MASRRALNCRSPASGFSARDLLWLALGLLVIVGTGIGVRDPWPADEPRFAVIARDMVLTGEWLFPRVGGDLYQDKPPLFFWMLAASYSLIGSVKASFLVPAFLAAGGVLLLIYDLGTKTGEPASGSGRGAPGVVHIAIHGRHERSTNRPRVVRSHDACRVWPVSSPSPWTVVALVCDRGLRLRAGGDNEGRRIPAVAHAGSVFPAAAFPLAGPCSRSMPVAAAGDGGLRRWRCWVPFACGSFR